MTSGEVNNADSSSLYIREKVNILSSKLEAGEVFWALSKFEKAKVWWLDWVSGSGKQVKGCWAAMAHWSLMWGAKADPCGLIQQTSYSSSKANGGSDRCQNTKFISVCCIWGPAADSCPLLKAPTRGIRTGPWSRRSRPGLMYHLDGPVRRLLG